MIKIIVQEQNDFRKLTLKRLLHVSCRDTASRVRRFQKRENHRAGTERIGIVRFVRLLQLSAAGEIPCAMLLAQVEGG